MTDSPLRALDEDTVRAALTGELAHWQLRNGMLERRYETGGWRASMMVANAIGHLAELAWHHPDLVVTFPAVTVRLVTHDVDGISHRDLSLARRIEALVRWRPTDADEGLTGLPDDPAMVYLRPDRPK
jgi:4a-hydroxytetrahydrobiopterin dehydratase